MPNSPSLLTYRFDPPLLPGRLVRRYNRFLADVELDRGGVVATHCVNTGRMEGLVAPGALVWVSPENAPTRRLKFTWQMIEIGGVMVGANTAIPNTLVGMLLRERLVPGLKKWDELKPEYRINPNSRVDFRLRCGTKQHFIEVKNCHLAYPDKRGYFPDSVSARAAKHLGELEHLVGEGHHATVIFTAQREDIRTMRPSDLHDPAFAAAARRAATAGVTFRAVRIRPTPEELIVEEFIPVDLKAYPLEELRGWKAANDATSGWIQIKKSAP